MGGMQRSAVVAAAGGADTVGAGENERSGEDGCVRGQLFEACIEQASEESRVVGDTHGASAGPRGERVWTGL
jgi:hypothetical protein